MFGGIYFGEAPFAGVDTGGGTPIGVLPFESNIVMDPATVNVVIGADIHMI